MWERSFLFTLGAVPSSIKTSKVVFRCNHHHLLKGPYELTLPITQFRLKTEGYVSVTNNHKKLNFVSQFKKGSGEKMIKLVVSYLWNFFALFPSQCNVYLCEMKKQYQPCSHNYEWKDWDSNLNFSYHMKKITIVFIMNI